LQKETPPYNILFDMDTGAQMAAEMEESDLIINQEILDFDF
jgi:hypothetical protein